MDEETLCNFAVLLNNNSSNNSNNPCQWNITESTPEYAVTEYIQVYADIIILPIGIVLNMLCFITFFKSKIYKTPTGLHLTYLALADNLVLLSLSLANTQAWSRYISVSNFRAFSLEVCSGIFYMVRVGMFWSSLLLVSATIERYLSVAFPLKVNSCWNLYSKTKTLMLVYVLVSFTLTTYVVFCFEIIETIKYGKLCEPSGKYQFCDTCEIIYDAVTSPVCFCLIFIFTVSISRILYKYKNKRSELGSDTSDSKKEFQITLMLVIVATLFLILRIPESVIYQLTRYFAANNISNSASEWSLTLYPFFYFMLVVNHSFNFVIYVLFVQSFRKSLVSLMLMHKPNSSRRKDEISASSSIDSQTVGTSN